MQYVVDNYTEIAEAALIVPMDETQAAKATVGVRGSDRQLVRKRDSRPTARRARWKPAHQQRQRDAGGQSPSASLAVAGARS